MDKPEKETEELFYRLQNCIAGYSDQVAVQAIACFIHVQEPIFQLMVGQMLTDMNVAKFKASAD